MVTVRSPRRWVVPPSPGRPILPRGSAAAFALAIAAAGCATVSGRSQRVALDDTPRGGFVRDAETPDAPPLGRTPTVIERSRAASWALVFEPAGEPANEPAGEPANAPPSTVTVDCDFRWRVVGLGNAPFLLVSLSLYGAPWVVAVGTDLLTGAAWDCPLIVRPPGAEDHPADANAPRHYLVLEPAHDDTAVQDTLARAWREGMATHLRPGDTVTLPEAHRTLLMRLGEPRRPRELTRRRLNTLLHATGATHLVTLRWSTAPAMTAPAMTAPPMTALDAELYDAYTEETAPAPPLAVTPIDTGDGSFRWQSLFEYLHFIPNSVAWLPGLTQFDAEARGDTKANQRDLETAPRASLPTWVSGWTLTSASHPDAFDAWDLHGKLEPTVGLNLLDVDVSVTGGTGGTGGTGDDRSALPDESERFQAWLMRVYYELGGTAHTPLGALDLSLLGGYALAWQDRWSGEAAHFRGRVELGLGITYTAFLGERLYFRAGLNQFVPVRPLLETSDFVAKNLRQGWVGLGIYLPETRWWTRSLFQSSRPDQGPAQGR